MSNLLQKASIVTTPTAYGVGVLNSIKPAQSFSEELIINGDFSNGGANWSYNINHWSFNNGTADCNGTQSGLSYLNQSGAIVSGKVYKATYEVTSITAGEIIVFVGDVSGLARTTVGVYTEYITATSTNFWLRASSTFVGSIDNVSVKEVTDADFDFTRTSSATRVNPDYLIETSATNTPRLDYTNGTASILLEPQSTNLIQYSEDLSDSYWSKTRASITDNSLISPDGNYNADKFTQITSTAWGGIVLTVSPSGTSTLSVFAKKIDNDYIAIIGHNSNDTKVYFNLNNGTIGTVGSDVTSSDIQDYGNGWYRCILTASVVNRFTVLHATADNGNTADLNTETSLWGAQLEEGSYATSYIPTDGSTVTRAAETLNNAGNSDLINSTEGVLYAEISALANSGTGRKITLNNGSNSNVLVLEYTSTANQIRVFLSNGSLQFNEYVTLSNLLEFNKIAIKYKANDFAIWINGVEVATDLSGTTFTSGTLTSLNFDDGSGFADFYGKCKMVAVFKEALSDTELACLTSTNNREIFLNYYYRMQYVEANTEALSCAEQTFNI